MSVFYIPTTDSTSSTTLKGDVTGSTSSSYISDLTVTSKLLTGMVISPGIVTASDSIRAAIGKLAAGFTSISTNSIESLGTTLNIATLNNTQTVNLGSGTGIQTINVGNSGAGATTINLGGTGDFVNIAGTLAPLTVKGVANQFKLVPSVDNAETSMVFNNLSSGGGTGWVVGQNIFSIGTGIFGIGGGAAGVVLQANSTTGFVTVPKTIVFPNAEVRKRIVLYDDGDATSQSDHRFNGFGKGNFTQVYQVKTTSENHSFCAATSATTSNELFRIAGGGAVTCGGSFTAGSITTGGLTSTGGAAITGAVTVASGGITVQNGVSCSALTTPYVIFPSGTLSYYEEYDHITTFNIPGISSPPITIRFTRIGRQVTAHVPELAMINSATSKQGLISSVTAFPSRFRSANPCYAYVSTNYDLLSVAPVYSAGCVGVTTLGLFEVHPTTSNSSFSVGPSYGFGFLSFTAIWTV